MLKKEKIAKIIFLTAMTIASVVLVLNIFSGNKKDDELTEGKTRFIIRTENDPFLGNKNAPVEIVNFSDFKCPWCAKWELEVTPLLKEDFINDGSVKLVFKNFAFLAEDSITAALAGEAIFHQDQEAFWEYIQLMYENQGNHKEEWATHDFIMELVKENIEGIDYDLLSKDIKQKTYLDEVATDKKVGEDRGVTGTPTIFVNGQKVEDSFDYESIKKLIEEDKNYSETKAN